MDLTPPSDGQELSGWLASLLQFSDSLFPTGSYAHSFGLEGAVQLGWVHDAPSLGDFIRHFILPALQHFELPFLAHAFQAAKDGELERLCQIDQQYGAMKGSRELRQASARLGSQRLMMGTQLSDHPLLQRLAACRCDGRIEAHSPIVFGVQSAVDGAPLDAALTAYYFQALASLLSASMKLIRIGQSGCQSLLGEFIRNADLVVGAAKKVRLDEAGWFSPSLEIASAQHERAYTRLFIS